MKKRYLLVTTVTYERMVWADSDVAAQAAYSNTIPRLEIDEYEANLWRQVGNTSELHRIEDGGTIEPVKLPATGVNASY